MGIFWRPGFWQSQHGVGKTSRMCTRVANPCDMGIFPDLQGPSLRSPGPASDPGKEKTLTSEREIFLHRLLNSLFLLEIFEYAP